MPRLWFRLDEVLPLAEHAMASPQHRVTAAQALAAATLRPALIWTSTDQADVLSSNGVPIWYDAEGHEHAAVAHTCRHAATGRRATPVQQPGGNGYLPLDRYGNSPAPMIDLLRHGTRTGKHWLVIDTDPQAGQRLRVLDHRDEIAPANTRWIPATVTAPATAYGRYPALIADGYTVAGQDVLARFDRATVDHMMTDLDAVHANPDRRSDPMPGEYPVLRLDGHIVVVCWEHDNGEHISLIEHDRVRPDADGHYSLGAYLWPWHIADHGW